MLSGEMLVCMCIVSSAAVCVVIIQIIVKYFVITHQ